MVRTGIASVVVMHPETSLRRLLHTALAESGYAVTEVPTYAAVLAHLRTAAAAARPMVVVAAHVALDFRAETAFFAQVAADASLAQQRRFVLLSTAADGLPDELGATLHHLDVLVLCLPARLDALLTAVAQAAKPDPRTTRTTCARQGHAGEVRCPATTG